MKNISLTLAEIATLVDGVVIGDANHRVVKLASLDRAGKQDLSFLQGSRLEQQLNATRAGCVLLSRDHASPENLNHIFCDNPYLAYALVAQKLDTTPAPEKGISERSNIHSSVRIGQNVSVAAGSVIARNCQIGNDVTIGSNCSIGENSIIGDNCTLHANVTTYHGITIGNSCILHSGVVIGGDGFGYARHEQHWVKIPQMGGVVLGDNVEVGVNSCIDRGSLNNTVIGTGVKIDNLCHIAHNVTIGDNTIMAGFSAIAGSATVGGSCQLGGRSSIIGHLEIAAGTHLTAGTLVSKSNKKPGVFSSGTGAEDNKSWKRNVARFKQLDGMAKRIKQLERRLELLGNE